MKELIRLLGYSAVAVVMTFLVIGVARSGASDATLAYSAIFIVVVLPIVVVIWAVRRGKKAEQNSRA